MFDIRKRIGILGGGQLGKMLCQAASPWDWKIDVLDPAPDAPASAICTRFLQGNFNNYEDVMRFGADLDLLTIEIEHVSTEALRALERLGKTVHPAPDVLDIIKDKGLQKQFYRAHGIPTTDFELFDDEQALVKAIEDNRWQLPLVQKTRTAGYDGRGVAVLRTRADLSDKLLKGPCIAEVLAPIRTELAVVAARNTLGETAVYAPVEMDFHPEANLLSFLLCPARISPLAAAAAEALAEQVIEAFGVCGLLAVEMFLTDSGELLVNEVAPRPHNSGHHTIESAVTSQYQQHWRAIAGLPLGDTRQMRPAAMINLLGAPGHHGPVVYRGAEACLAIPGVGLHLYGKAETRPFRKMGHATIVADTVDEALERAERVSRLLVVEAEVR
ncbi:MAG: 5-(carboxyamino)imidazole ribonucleotide synthase [Saprospiraceae bacterium]|nr:5-(carboxyamino)imidazole ribonucleotide synthase [Saprospiraceae bacterium]